MGLVSSIAQNIYSVACSVVTFLAYRTLPDENDRRTGENDEDFAGGHAQCRIVDGDEFKKTHMVPERYAVEQNFLLRASESDSPWRRFVPRYLREDVINGQKYIVLENTLFGIETPMTLDLKLGTQTWVPGASPEKIEKMDKKDAMYTNKSLGFRLTSARLIDETTAKEDTGLLKFKSLPAGRTLEKKGTDAGQEWRVGYSIKDVEAVLKCYFYGCRPLLEGFLQELEAIVALFKTQTEFHFIGLSLFVVYDSDLLLTAEGPVPRVLLIDFAHVLPGNGAIDEGVLMGLESVRAIANRFLAESRSPTNAAEQVVNK